MTEELAELRTPLEVIRRMDWVLTQAKRGTKVIHEARTEYLQKKHDYLLAYKLSRLDATGTVDDRADSAQVANWGKFQQMEIAELALQHAREKRKDLEDELSKLQSESAMIRAEMGLTR